MCGGIIELMCVYGGIVGLMLCGIDAVIVGMGISRLSQLWSSPCVCEARFSQVIFF